MQRLLLSISCAAFLISTAGCPSRPAPVDAGVPSTAQAITQSQAPRKSWKQVLESAERCPKCRDLYRMMVGFRSEPAGDTLRSCLEKYRCE
jgi:hypothetical protein